MVERIILKDGWLENKSQNQSKRPEHDAIWTKFCRLGVV